MVYYLFETIYNRLRLYHPPCPLYVVKCIQNSERLQKLCHRHLSLQRTQLFLDNNLPILHFKCMNNALIEWLNQRGCVRRKKFYVDVFQLACYFVTSIFFISLSSDNKIWFHIFDVIHAFLFAKYGKGISILRKQRGFWDFPMTYIFLYEPVALHNSSEVSRAFWLLRPFG